MLRINLDGSGGVASSMPIPLSPYFSYVVTTRVKTKGLARDAAWVTLRFVDAAGQVLETHDSPLIGGETDWQTVEIGPLTPANDKTVAALLTLQLRPRWPHGDLTGSAAFDDVWLARLPRIALICQSPHAPVYARRLVRNPLRRFGHRRALSGGDIRAVRSSGSTSSPATGRCWTPRPRMPSATRSPARAVWRPPLPDYGFFQVRAALHGKDQTVLDRRISLALLRPIAAPPRGEFGWSLHSDHEPLPPGPLASLLGQVGIHWAKVPVWFDPRDTQRAEQIASFAEQVSLQNIELVGVLDQPPAELRKLFREQGRLPVASVFIEPELWQPALSPVLTRLSLKIRWWQLGQDDDASYVSFPQLDRKIAEIKKALEQFGQEIHLGLTWRLPYDPPRVAAPPWAYLSLTSDPGLTAEELVDYLPGLKRPGTQRWLVIHPLPRGEYSTESRARDLVMRMISAKLSGADAAFIPQPFDPADGPGEPRRHARRAAPAVADDLAAHLRGPSIWARCELPGGSTNHIFARDGKAVMVVWSDEPTTEQCFFGDDIEQLDLWGRSTRPQARRARRPIAARHRSRPLAHVHHRPVRSGRPLADRPVVREARSWPASSAAISRSCSSSKTRLAKASAAK